MYKWHLIIKITFCQGTKHTGNTTIGATVHTVYDMLLSNYRISSVIRRSFFLPKQSKDLDPSYKTDLDLWDCLGRVKLV